jgi:toxin ParE1/3/4
MPTVIRTNRAESDLCEIWLYISEQSVAAADQFLETIEDKCQLLAAHPELGQSRPELAPRLRSFSVGRYVIFYRPIEDGIELVRVIYGGRDIDALFGHD